MARPRPEVHPLLEPLSFLLGDWTGQGEGLFPPPAGQEHRYGFEDSLTYFSDGRPVIEYHERTRSIGGVPSHLESGYLIAVEGGSLQMTVAEPSGSEVLAGEVHDGCLTLRSVAVARAPGTKNVTATARRLHLEHGHLVSEVDIALDGGQLEPHTRSILRRPGDDLYGA